MIFDFAIIGAGISGAAAASELSARGTAVLIEAETAPGYHSTGRSAALFTPHYGAPLVRLINRASRAFMTDPPAGFCEIPILSRRGMLTIASPGEEAALDELLAQSTAADPVVRLDGRDALARAPFLRPERVGAAAWEENVDDIDVAALHQGFLRDFKKAGGVLMNSMRVARIGRANGVWEISGGGQTVRAATVINAAGAWADIVGQLAGALPVGLVARRRTAVIVAAPEGVSVAGVPVIGFTAAPAYIKPDAGRLMVSPGDETPVEPQDIRPEEYDIAVLADWLETETLVKVRRIEHSWAGLRTFTPDNAPVAGFDSELPGFFWLAGQGGFGIMLSPALARTTAGLVCEERLPDDLKALGITEKALSPRRFQATSGALPPVRS